MLHTKEQIGRMDYRITFQQKVIGVNASNEDEEAGWENIASNPTVWASKTEKSGNEAYRADKLVDYHALVFVCRYRTDVNAEMRVVCGGVAYNIVSPPVEIGRKRYLSIETESGGEFIETAEAAGIFDLSFDPSFE